MSDLSDEGEQKRREIKCRNENMANLFGMTLIARKERQTNGNLFEKTLSLQM